MAKSRQLTGIEFDEAKKLGGQRGKPVSNADFEQSKVKGEDVFLYDSNGSLVFATTLMAISKEESEKKKKTVKELSDQANKIGIGCGLLAFMLLIAGSVSIYQAYEKKKEESRLARIDYIKNRIRRPVASYDYTNEIFDEISKNKVRFKQQKNGKVIHVTGYIAKDNISENSVAIDGYGTLLPPKVRCNVMPEFRNKLSGLSAGQTILIAGTVDYSDGAWDTVDLDNCIFFTNVEQRGSMRMWDVVEPMFRY